MKAFGALLAGIALFAANQPLSVCAEMETIDLKALAKKARPSVMLLVVSDAAGKEIATGTGFLVSGDGKLITNFHVIKKAVSVVAKAENGRLFPVEGVLASNPKNDLVLLKIKSKKRDSVDKFFDELRKKKGLLPEPGFLTFPFLTLDNSDKIDVGTRIAVIGSPLGLEGTLSEGIVSAVRELMTDMKMLQISAAISPGSSGSPVLNSQGEVIGVATSSIRSGQALNFALPASLSRALIHKAAAVSVPQPFANLAVTEADRIYSDLDWQALNQAATAEDYIAMLKHAQALVRRFPDNSTAYYMLGLAYWRLNFLDDAIAACKQAIKLTPEDANAWYGLGYCYGQAGRPKDAITAHRQAIKIKPDYAEAWNNLGIGFEQLQLWEDAIGALKQAVKLRPDFINAWGHLGFCYGQTRRWNEAIAACNQNVKLDPTSATAWENLGCGYEGAGRKLEAASAFQRARNLKK